MNRHVSSIAGRLSLRPPQRRSLEILDRVTEIVPPKKGTPVDEALAAIRAEYPSVTDFEREFPSLCFALATGVGKTRLIGAFITYLHLAHGINNFFVLAPNLTIYRKLIADFTPNTAKYVFRGIAEFATDVPELITGDDYESRAGSLFDDVARCKVNVFNISKINSEVRGGRAPRIKKLSEYIGESYFAYLAGLPDLVLLMDESHRYRASAGVRAINELKPVLGLELTATPFVETARGAVPFRNVIYDYPLGRAMEDGFVKEPAVVTRKNFSASGMSADAIEQMKLEDGVRLHESVKVELETYARQTGNAIVKPFLLVIARDTTHAKQLLDLVESDAFFAGRYRGRAIQVDSSRTGADEEAMIERLLKVEHTDEPTEIVIHVNMLKEGWDVTNLYTIVPLRAANARILIEQSIGRGLRLPYGRRTGVDAVDTLNIVAHDRFQEIVDEARRPDSPVRMRAIVLDAETMHERTVTVVSQPQLLAKLGLLPPNIGTGTTVAGQDTEPGFAEPESQRVAQIAYEAIRTLATQPQKLPVLERLTTPAVQAEIVRRVEAEYQPAQTELSGIVARPDIAAIVARTTELVTQETIGIPRILVLPRDETAGSFEPFALDLGALRFPPVDADLWSQHLRTGAGRTLAMSDTDTGEPRLENYIVRRLMDRDDVAYDEHADLLYDLAAQAVRHFETYLSEHEAAQVVRVHHRPIADNIHAQMQQHYRPPASGYEVRVSRGVTELKPSAYSAAVHEPVMEYRVSPPDRSNMARYLFGGFARCLYPVQKFDSDAERRLAVILERESAKWFRPARGQFQIFYRNGADHAEYQPDFVAETEDAILMLEPKARGELEAADVTAKKVAAEEWCRHASDHARAHGGKRWRYALIPHDVITENMTLAALAQRYATQ